MQLNIKDLILYRLEKSKQDFESAGILLVPAEEIYYNE